MNKKKAFSIGEAFKFGWNTLKKNLPFFIGLGLILRLINYVPLILKPFILKDQGMLILLVNIVIWVLQFGVAAGFLYIGLRFVDGKKSKFSDLFSQFKPRLLFNYFLLSVMLFFAMIAGFLLLIIPGIIVMVRGTFSQFLVIDKNAGPFQSLNMSWKMTKGNFGKLFLLGLALLGITLLSSSPSIVGSWVKIPLGINLLTLLSLVVGLFTFPIILLSSAYVYRKLSS